MFFLGVCVKCNKRPFDGLSRSINRGNKNKKNCQVCHRIFLSMALLGDFKVEMDGIYNSVIAMKHFFRGLS
jgi:hypothetical protein